jgi:hypothetical protein
LARRIKDRSVRCCRPMPIGHYFNAWPLPAASARNKLSFGVFYAGRR